MLSRTTNTLRTAALAANRRAVVSVPSRAWSSLKTEPQYSAKATTVGSRADGQSKLDDGKLELKMDLPKALGGAGKHHNPEDLFAMAYSTCFLSAMGAVYKEKFSSKTGKTFSSGATVNAEVVVGLANDAPGFRLAVHLKVPFDSLKSTQLTREDAEALVKGAHEVCPYSRAIRGNVEQKVELV